MSDAREWRSQQEEHDMNIIKLNATKWTIELVAQREIQTIQRQTTERLELLEDDHDIEVLELLRIADINVATIRCQRGIERLRALIWHEKFTAGPIHRLPVEMLSEIFSYYAEFDLSPWGLVKVCKTWMDTALRTPQLWRRIHFTNDEPTIDDTECWVVDGRRQFSLGNVQICLKLIQVKAAVTRSGAMPLEVTIQHYANQFPNTDISPVIALLVKDPTSRRIRSLDITSTELPKLAINPGQFPLLKYISWRGTPLPWLLQLFRMISTTPNDLDFVSLSCTLPSQLVDLPFWSRIRAISLLNIDSFNSELNKVAHKLTGLEGHFEGTYQWPNAHTPALRWPKIRSLSLQCCPLKLAHLHLPHLERLEINENPIGMGVRKLPYIAFPSLTTLKVTSWAIDWLSSVSAPRLTKLDLNSSWTQEGDDWSLMFRGLSFPTVRELTMGHKWNDSAVVAALESVPNVIYLKLLGTIRPFNCRIWPLSHLSYREYPACLRLASLLLGDEIWPVYTQRERIVPVITQLVGVRKTMEIPLQALSVYWGPEIRSPGDVIETFT